MLDRVSRVPWTSLVLLLVALDLVCRLSPGLAAWTVGLDTLAVLCSLGAMVPRPLARPARAA